MLSVPADQTTSDTVCVCIRQHWVNKQNKYLKVDLRENINVNYGLQSKESC